MSKQGYETEPWRAPAVQADETLLYCEHGRILHRTGPNGVDYRSHWFRIVKQTDGGKFLLLVKHGGGEERIELGLSGQVASVSRVTGPGCRTLGTGSLLGSRVGLLRDLLCEGLDLGFGGELFFADLEFSALSGFLAMQETGVVGGV